MTKRIIVIYKQFDIVAVPFPFVDSFASKKRPAIILSSGEFNQANKHSIMAMITSARNHPWFADVPITDITCTGLSKPSIIRMKFFTLDHRLILNPLGTLSKKDRDALRKMIKSVVEL